MKKPLLSFAVNLALLFSGLITAFSGILLQIKFHINHIGNGVSNDHVFGIGYSEWSAIHKTSIVVFSLFMIFHIYLHWKWYKAIINKRLFAKNKQVLTLTIIFLLVAITGFIPWIIYSTGAGDTEREAFIEIHDKLAILLSVYLLLHITKRLKWFLLTWKKLEIMKNI